MMKTQSASVAKNVFLTSDIQLMDWDSEAVDRYEYPRAELAKQDYDKENLSDEEFQQWCENNLSYNELYVLPMMNYLRYFPRFCSFSEEDQKKCNKTTVLIYDTLLDQWAVGLTGGGMDLAPHLLETFINLECGVPLELAKGICKDYSAYVDEMIHVENCKLLAVAFHREAKNNLQRGNELGLIV